jgi:hypothetical protein
MVINYNESLRPRRRRAATLCDHCFVKPGLSTGAPMAVTANVFRRVGRQNLQLSRDLNLIYKLFKSGRRFK